jgi:ppGpp synthetase/RelA/SpoT-type nucleotidyltranferase
MSALEAALERYLLELPQFVAAADEMNSVLTALCQSVGVLAIVEVREKKPGSFVKKALSKEGYSDEPWTKTTDKVGARIVVQTLSERQRIREALRNSALEIISEEDKGEERHANELFYPGIHFQVKVPSATLSTGDEIECEIQLRTKAEDLWSVPSHKLLYKGVISPSRRTERRIWRLSALIEVFDEEVERAMNDVLGTPNYAQATLLSIAEDSYFTVVPVPGERDLSLDVLLALADALPIADDAETYRQLLESFTQENRARLKEIYSRYGEGSEFEANAKYWLFTQPESIILFERISNQPMLTREVVQQSELGYAVEPLFRAWGTSYEVA